MRTVNCRKTKFGFLLGIALAALTLFSSPSFAKDLTNRLGVGFKNQFDGDLPGIAVQYYPGPELGLSATLAVDTKKDNSSFGALVKMYRIVFQEDNMNFYLGAGAGLLSQEVIGVNQSGFELMAYTGCEFFLPGLENLGFSFEAGTMISSLSSSVRFRTFGDAPTRAGVIFYF